MNQNDNDILNSDMFDVSLDDMADLPEYKPFKEGAHKALVNFKAKKIGEHPAVEMNMKLVSTVELTTPGDTPDEPGCETSVAYMLDNQFGQGNLKLIITPICERLGINMRQKGFLRLLVENCKDMECLVVSNIRKGKEEGQVYMNVKQLAVV